MQLGVIYPQRELAGDPTTLRDFAQAAEQLGYQHLVIYDHPIGLSRENRDPPIWGPYTDKDPFVDPLTAFAYLAGLTTRIELVTGVLNLPVRQTVLVAQQTADIDLMSGERLRLGVGVGYIPQEFHALGADFSTRGKKLNEQIPYLRRLWSEELIDYEGRFDQIDRGNIMPRPNRQIPIWCGGFADAMFRRAVKLADGFIFGYGLEQDAAEGWVRMQQMLEEAGRPVDGFGAQFLMMPPENQYGDEQIVEGVLRLREAGATHASVFTMERGLRDVGEHIDYIAGIKARCDAAIG